MGCNCGAGKKSATKYIVTYANGTTYRSYGTKIEADAAAKRIGGKVKTG